MESPECQVAGFLAAGHVCTIMGVEQYRPLAQKYQVPIVVTGFEPLDLAYGILTAVKQLEAGRFEVENAYARTTPAQGNRAAQAVIQQVFEPCDRAWRGIGVIPQSGYRLREGFAEFDAERRFEVEGITARESPLCIAGEILQGLKKPDQCSAFGTRCTPEHPLGAPMVSTEGACSAYYQFGRTG